MMTEERESVNEFQTPPQLQKTNCKFMAICLQLFLQFFSVTATLAAWYFYSYFTAAATLALSFIFMGIIRSKLKNSAIPSQQLEHIYTDKEIAYWYIARRICF